MSFVRIRAVINGVSGLPGLSTFYYSTPTSPPSTAEMNDVTGRVRSAWVAVVAQLAAGTTIDVQRSGDVLDPTTGALLGRALAGSTPSTVTSTGTQELPPATALGLQLQTSTVVNGRIVQGRSFISPLALAANSNGVPSAGAVSAVAAFGTALLTGATASALVVWHRPTPGGSNGSQATVLGAVPDSSKLWVLRSRRD